MTESMYLPKDSVVITSAEYAVLQRIAGAAECVATAEPTTWSHVRSLHASLALVLSDYPREKATVTE